MLQVTLILKEFLRKELVLLIFMFQISREIKTKQKRVCDLQRHMETCEYDQTIGTSQDELHLFRLNKFIDSAVRPLLRQSIDGPRISVPLFIIAYRHLKLVVATSHRRHLKFLSCKEVLDIPYLSVYSQILWYRVCNFASLKIKLANMWLHKWWQFQQSLNQV